MLSICCCYAQSMILLPILCECPARNMSTLLQLRMMCQLYNSVEVTILPPYIPSQKEQANPRIYASNVRRLFADTLQLPMVEQVSPKIRLATSH